jgi:hypothetical protein
LEFAFLSHAERVRRVVAQRIVVREFIAAMLGVITGGV